MYEHSELEAWLSSLDHNWNVYVKRLSANDTGLTGGHQAGIYIPKSAGSRIFPNIQRTDIKNPDHYFPASIDSHYMPEQDLRVIYYNNKHYENKRNGRDEQRITQWKHLVGTTPVQDPEMTGALCIFAFHVPSDKGNCDYLKVWVCRSVDEEDFAESLVGDIYPGEWLCDRYDELMGGMYSLPPASGSSIQLPEKWHTTFPSGTEIIEFVINSFDELHLDPDRRLLRRRNHEFSVFRSIEDLHILDTVSKGFESVDDFIAMANSVSNRRKSRSGRSLELHLEKIFCEEGLTEYGTQCETEKRKKPDFLFPSCDKYHDPQWPSEKLGMLAVKTTCKDRWRQILDEAARIEKPYLFTLQEGVTENQFDQMQSSGITLVVPTGIHNKYPEIIRNELLSLAHFIELMRNEFSQ